MTFTLIAYGGLIVFGGIAFWAFLQARATAAKKMQAIAVGTGFVTILFAVFALILAFAPGLLLPSGVDNEERFQYFAYKAIGEQIAERHPGANVLVISYPPSKDPVAVGLAEARSKGLSEGLNGKARLSAVTLRTVEGVDPAAAFTPQKFDSIIENSPMCNVVLSLAGLPPGAGGMKYWKDARKGNEVPSLVLVNVRPTGLRNAIKTGVVSAALCRREGNGNYEGIVLEGDTFSKQYFLITPDNVDEIAEKNEKIFGGTDYLGVSELPNRPR